MVFELVSYGLGVASGLVLAVSSTAVYNFAKSKVSPKTVASVNAAVTDVTSIEAAVTQAATHVAGLKSTVATLASLAAKL